MFLEVHMYLRYKHSISFTNEATECQHLDDLKNLCEEKHFNYLLDKQMGIHLSIHFSSLGYTFVIINKSDKGKKTHLISCLSRQTNKERKAKKSFG